MSEIRTAIRRLSVVALPAASVIVTRSATFTRSVPANAAATRRFTFRRTVRVWPASRLTRARAMVRVPRRFAILAATVAVPGSLDRSCTLSRLRRADFSAFSVAVGAVVSATVTDSVLVV